MDAFEALELFRMKLMRTRIVETYTISWHICPLARIYIIRDFILI